MLTQIRSEPATDGALLKPVRKLEETQRNGRSFERLVVYYAISTTFTRILDVIYLRCYFLWSLVPDLHVVLLIFTVISRRWSTFCWRGNRNLEKLGKFPQALQILRVRAGLQVQVRTTSKSKQASPCWTGWGITWHSVKTTSGRMHSSFHLHAGSPSISQGQWHLLQKCFFFYFPLQWMSQGGLPLILVTLLRIP